MCIRDRDKGGSDKMGKNEVPKMAKLKLGVDKVYPIVRIWWESQQVTLAEKLNSWNTVSFKDVEFISACDKTDQEIMGYNFEDLTLTAQRLREFGIDEEDLKKAADNFEYAFELVNEAMLALSLIHIYHRCQEIQKNMEPIKKLLEGGRTCLDQLPNGPCDCCQSSVSVE